MDRFVWFVLLVVISHLVTEFTRVTGYTRGPRQDVAMVNDSSIQPTKVQNQILYPGREYGLYELQSQQYYSGHNPYNNYANSENYKTFNLNTNNFLSSLFNRVTKSNNNNRQEEEQPQSNMPIRVNSNNLLNLPTSDQTEVKTFSFLRPLIDSIFEIPISALRAVNDLVGRLAGGIYPQPQKQIQIQQQEYQAQPTKYSFYPPYLINPNSYYGLGRSAGASASASASAVQPKTQYEMLNQKRPLEETKEAALKPPSPTTTPSLKPRTP